MAVRCQRVVSARLVLASLGDHAEPASGDGVATTCSMSTSVWAVIVMAVVLDLASFSIAEGVAILGAPPQARSAYQIEAGDGADA